MFDVPKDLPENAPAQTMVAGNQEDLNDLAIADLGAARPNILEDTEDAEAAVGQALPPANLAAPTARPLGREGLVGQAVPPASGATPRPVYGPPPPVQTAPAVVAPPASPKPPWPRVPNFRGMTMRAVLAEAAAKGLSILPDGSGVARVQSPPPGAPLHQGERIRAPFAQ